MFLSQSLQCSGQVRRALTFRARIITAIMSNTVKETVAFVAAVLGQQATAQELAAETVHVGSTCQAIAQRSASKDQLLGGASAGAQAEVQQWLIWAGKELTPLMDDKLLQVNAWLETRTFIAGNQFTLADLVVFGMTHPATTKFPIAQYNHFCSLLRWADLIQARVGSQVVAATLSNGPLTVVKPLYVPPPPPAAPVASTSAPAAKGDAGKAQGAAAPAAAAAAPAAAAKKQDRAAPAPAAGPENGNPTPTSKADKGKKGGDSAAAAAGGGQNEKGKGKGKEGGKKEEAAPAVSDADITVDILDIRVGKIVKVGKHPNADSLYVEEIDLGEAQPRQVISGLVKFVSIEEMQDRRVLVVCNLKPAKMRDVMSYGMVLCASNDTHDKVVPVSVPEGVPLGERVTAQGFTNEPWPEVNCKKKNYLEMLFPDLKTNADGVAVYKGAPFLSSGGPITAPLTNAWVK